MASHFRAAIDGTGHAHPFHEGTEGVFQLVLGLKAEQVAGLGDIGKAVADVAGTGLVHDFRLDLRHTHGVREKVCDLLHRIGLSAADIDDMAVGARLLQRQPKGAGDVTDMHEIAPLLAVLEDRRRLAIGKPRRKIGEHAGIGIGKGLSCAKDVE